MTPDDARRATAIARGAAIHRAAWANLRHMSEQPLPFVSRPGAWRGLPALVVGAGWTLDDDSDALRHIRARAITITVNTALGALHHHGVDPDYIVTLESVDLSHQWSGQTDATVIAGIGTHPAAFALADAAILEASPAHVEISRALDVPMIGWGGSAMTAAYALARFAGCSPIIMIGSDFCIDVEGRRSYATGAGWDGLRVDRDGDELVFSGRPDRDEAHRAAGVPPVPRRRPAIEADGCVTTDDLMLQAGWFRDHASADTVNATRLGLELGMRRDPGVMLPPMLRTPVPVTGQPVDGTPAVAVLRDEARRCLSLADRMLDGQGIDLSDCGGTFIESLCHGDWLGMQSVTMRPPDRLRAQYEVLRVAAMEILGGGER